MIAARRAPWPRRCLGGGLIAVVLLLSGCVYLRLLEFKRQLEAFDRYFTIEAKDGLHLGCLKPILLSEDFRWLGFTPATTQRLGQSEQWHVRWVKQLPPGVVDPVVRDLEIDLIFTEDKLTRLLIPERYFALVPKTFLVGLLRGFGTAKVDKENRLAIASYAPIGDNATEGRVLATGMAALLGPPSRQWTTGPRTMLAYRYLPTPPGARNGMFDITFTFDTASGQLVLLQGLSPVGQISFNFEPSPLAAGAPPAPTPKD